MQAPTPNELANDFFGDCANVIGKKAKPVIYLRQSRMGEYQIAKKVVLRKKQIFLESVTLHKSI